LLKTVLLPPDKNISVETEGKIETILKAAQKRLGIYGYDKTTMQEIAEDISMSKAALYYYFPDKERLFRAVLENEQKEYFLLLEQKISTTTAADQLIMELVELRHSLFRRFLNLGKFRLTDHHKVKPMLQDLYMKLRENENNILATLFKKGKESGIFILDDSVELALLYSDMLQGIRMIEMKRMTHIEMTDAENDRLFCMLRKASQIFLNGLKYNAITNSTL